VSVLVKRVPKLSAGKSAPEPETGSAPVEDEFARAMADVIPLGRERPDRVPLGSPDVQVSRPADKAPTPERRQEEGVESSFVAPGVDRRELRRLKRGEHAIKRRLDLHGLKADEALARVNRFLERSRHARHRAVCIVHGRGLNSRDGIAILKARVRKSLQSHRAVLAFTDAPPGDGGTGAVYVLLRK
jgi:DNA-nicking Smr family endonuclease